MKCKIQWIDENAQPTPDDNEAIGLAVTWDERKGVRSAHETAYPICAEHAKRLVPVKICWPGTEQEVTNHWQIVKF